MATLSDHKYFNRVKRKRKVSDIESYTTNLKGEVLATRVTDNFLYIRNQTTKEYQKLFPVNDLSYLDVELLEDGSFMFVVIDYNGLSVQIRNFERGTLTTIQLEVDKECSPCIILDAEPKGLYYSRDGKIIYRKYTNGVLGGETVILEVEDEHLDYAAHDQANNCVKIVTKLSSTDKVNESIPEQEIDSKEFTSLSDNTTWSKKE